MQRRENDFPSSTKLILAKRVVFLCSRASCRRPTSGPHTDDAKATLIGEAAHITAAAPGGPRFDPSLTSEERRDADNGIWLCAACATEVDKDPDRFPVSLLRKWKLDAEAEALKLLENPTYSKLGISRAPFSPPLDYQRSALEQVVSKPRPIWRQPRHRGSAVAGDPEPAPTRRLQPAVRATVGRERRRCPRRDD